MNTPDVSVALCTYNGARFLPEQLASIAGQDRLPDELVVCDDGSTDATISQLEDFARTAPFSVRMIRQPKNLGFVQNFGAAISECRGDLIALCDQDDVWRPGKLRMAVDFFAARPGCLALFSDAVLVDDSLRPLDGDSSLWNRMAFTAPLRQQLGDPGQSLAVLAGRYLVTGATLIIRRELAARAVPIPRDLPPLVIHDGWLALVAAALGGLDCLAEQTILYRQHEWQQQGVRATAPRPSARDGNERFGSLAASLTTLHELLMERVGSQAVPGALEELGRRAAHLRLRTELPTSGLERFRRVWLELRRGNYHRYCRRPVLAAMRDIAFR